MAALGTSNANPVRGPLSNQAGADAVKQMKGIFDQWKGSPDFFQSAGDYFSTRNASTEAILMVAEMEAQFDDNLQSFVYEVNGIPVGVMLVQVKDDCVYVDAIVTNPLQSGCGGALIEAAVRYSHAQGKAGTVKLLAAGDDACAAYFRMGFLRDDGGTEAAAGPMTLNPGTSAAWAASTDGPALAAHAGKRYVTGFG